MQEVSPTRVDLAYSKCCYWLESTNLREMMLDWTVPGECSVSVFHSHLSPPPLVFAYRIGAGRGGAGSQLPLINHHQLST